MLKKHSPELVFLNGHGNSDCVTGHNQEILIKANDNEQLLANSITYALSCSSGKTLGPKAVERGTRAYIGYENEFIFFISKEKIRHPEEDKTAEMFLGPANHVVLSLAKGHTVREACSDARKYFYQNVRKLLTSEVSPDEKQYIRFLLWNMQNLVAHGDTATKALIIPRPSFVV
ncbi:hypothetical protein GCM10023093_07270 [Nemorincola caseinilytica]|uniref:CHAT domain-containing protein n=2 Tax=Nemorincola caseinilytica TaxID=2054315 RepID=A0ABP8N5U3_9BACT